MKYPERTVSVVKPAAAVREILNTCASRHKAGTIRENDFQIYCSRRHNGGFLNHVKFTGTISGDGTQTQVTLSPWVGLTFWIGCGVYLLGLVDLVCSGFAAMFNPVPALGSAVLGTVFVAADWWEGQSHLESIQRKLQG